RSAAVLISNNHLTSFIAYSPQYTERRLMPPPCKTALVGTMTFMAFTGADLLVVHSFHITMIHPLMLLTFFFLGRCSTAFFHQSLHHRIIHIHLGVIHFFHRVTIGCFRCFGMLCGIMGKTRSYHQYTG